MWIFCSGMMRSGSTLQYQIAKSLVEEAGLGAGVGSCVPGRFGELLDRYDDPTRVHIVKSHRYLPTAAARLRAGNARSLYIYRDIRDVVVSMMHKEAKSFGQLMDERFVETLLQDDAHWSSRPNTLVSRYEDATANLEAEVERIAAFLEVPRDRAEIQRIAETHSIERQSRRIRTFDFGEDGVAEGKANLVDPETLLHHNHVRSGATGQWTEALTPEQVARIERIAGPWLVDRGYALSELRSPGIARRLRHAFRRRGADARRWWTDARFRLAPRTAALKSVVLRPPRRALGVLTSVELAHRVGGLLYRWTGRRRDEAIPLGDARRILVVRVDEIGDVVLTSPLLRELRRNAPDAEITLVVKPEVRNLVEHCPHVDRVLTYQWAVSGFFGRLKRHLRALRLARRLWPARFDLAVLPRWARDRYHGTFLTYFSGAERRIGYSETVTDKKRRMNAGADRLFTHTLTTEGPKHEVERNLDVLRALGGDIENDRLELWLGPVDVAFASSALGDAADHGPIVTFGLGAGAQRRVWPLLRYAEVATRLQERHDARIVLLGSATDRALGERFRRQIGDGVVDLIGLTTLRQAAAVLERSDLYIGNDTGVMHLAAAAGIPVVEVSCHPRTGSPDHDHSPDRFGPWGVSHRILRPDQPQPPCTDGCENRIAHCITSVSVEQVLEAAIALLEPARSARGSAAGPLH